MEEVLNKCRLCKDTRLVDVIDLGEQIITSRWPVYGDFSTPSTKIVLVQCEACSLVQLKHTVSASELYEYEYGYRSGISNTMRKHLEEYNKQVQTLACVKEGDIVLDIGSNDTTFLRYYSDAVKRVGCDPTGKQFREYYKDDVALIPTYFTKQAIVDKFGDSLRFKAVTSISMFYDLPDPVQFARDIYSVLEDNGVWSLEQSYCKTMLEGNSIDTICHEHLEYYNIKQIKDIMDRSGFKIIHLELNDCNGGSMRVFVSKRESLHSEICVDSYINAENEMGIHSPSFYKGFMERCKKEVDRLNILLTAIRESGQEAWIYGASTKGNCLLQFGNIGEDKCRYAVERNLSKVGKMTSTGIKIISEEEMRKSSPAFLLVLPWHFREEIIQREDAFLSAGGQFIFPFPHMEIVSKKPRALITGWSGQIASYVREELCDKYSLYGVGSQDGKGTVFTRDQIEESLDCVRPSIVVNLAGISNSEDAKNSIVKTLEVNGLLCARICEYIYKNNLNTKLFNASSSELFKGHQEYTINEDDTHFNHVHPYSIGKKMSHDIVNYYRIKYNLPFSNGILFMTDSPLRKSSFLIPKCIQHAKGWRTNKTVLKLGSLESYRNVNYAEDVAKGINIILEKEKGDSYLICGDLFIKVEELVKAIYKRVGIELSKDGDCYVDKVSGKAVLEIDTSFRDMPTKINGKCVKLRELGWVPKCSTLENYVDELWIQGAKSRRA